MPRYGRDIVGGAETLCRTVAEGLAEAGQEVEVFTTCARDHFTWRNELTPGTTIESGVPVHRFPVDEDRDHERFAEVHHRIARRIRVGYLGQLEWMANSVTSPQLEDEVRRRTDLWCLIALPYLFGTSFWCVQNEPRRTVLNPCLHDEPHAWTDATRAMLDGSVGCMANTQAEQRLLSRIAPGARTRLGGIGFDIFDAPADSARLLADRGLEPGYLLYAGRREEGKGLGTLFDYYRRLVADRPSAPQLALMGTGGLVTPPDIAHRVIDLGFVPEEDKRAAYAGALCLVHPSRMESFGIVLMEAWREGVPAVVTAHGEVLTDHCRASGGGLWYRDYAEFAETVGLLMDQPETAEVLGRAGAAYVKDRYSHDAVCRRYIEALTTWL